VTIEIKARFGGRVLYTAESAADVRAAVLEAVGKDAYLGGADLRGADLGGAYLGGAYLGGADLRGAYLGGADLRGAYLRGADLRGAYLRGADLRGAYLRGADLRGAYLRGAYLGGAYLGGADLGGAYLGGADLRGAYLRGADLRGAYLRGAYLRGADLRGADLRGAYLGGAYLGGADLRGADLPSSPLFMFRIDLWDVLDQAPAEVAGLRASLVEGRVDGSVYEGVCACLVGTIANVRGVPVDEVGIPRAAERPAEQWFMPIRKGDLPDEASLEVVTVDLEAEKPSSDVLEREEAVYRATLAVQWIDEWMESRTALVKALGGTLA
jgi:uncharacterized protein YjbI with pentapeptide repeats